MKLLLTLALAPVLALGDCTSSLTGLMGEMAWLISAGTAPEAADENTAKICLDQTATNDMLTSVVAACGGGSSLAPILDLMKDVLCTKAKDSSGTEQFCLPSLAAMVPWTGPSGLITLALAKPPDMSSIDFYAALTNGKNLELICRTDTCTKSIARRAINATAEAGMDSKLIWDIIDVAGSACVGVGDVQCAATDITPMIKTETDGTLTLDKALACENGKLKPCVRKLCSTRRLDVKDPCKDPPPADEVRIAVGEAVIQLKGIAFTYYEANKEQIMGLLKGDLGSNIAGLLPDNIDLTITSSNDSPPGLLVSVTFYGEELITVDIDLATALEYFQKYVEAGGLVSLPGLDTLAMGSVSESLQLVSASANVTATTTTIAGGSTGTNGNSEDTSSAMSTSVGASVGLVLLATLLSM